MTGSPDSVSMGIRNAADILRGRKNTVVLTGAGISTPSGIPDFRSPDNGLWGKFDPFEVASLTTFRHDPGKFFHWMRPLAATILNADPNAAHEGLARLEQAGMVQTIITQNIDTLHQRAGSLNVLEVHGSIEHLVCVSCYDRVDSRDYLGPYIENGQIPYCLKCGNILKPDMVFMGEQLPSRVWLQAQDASKNCDLMIVAGSSLEVLPVAGLPMRALENSAHMILINHSQTYIDVRCDVVFHEDVVEIIPRIVAEVLGE